MDKIILDMCGGTGAWSKPYRDAGYDVRLLTLPADVRLIAHNPNLCIHGILAAPPCRCFAHGGMSMPLPITEVYDALSIVDACLRAVTIYRPSWWCLENPPKGLAKYLGKPKCVFQPWEYGGFRTKRTALWGEFTIPPKKIATKPENTTKTASIGRWGDIRRAETPSEFADAFFQANP